MDLQTYRGDRQHEIPRPCYHLLRLLGMWQPINSHAIFKAYNVFCYFIWIGALAATVSLSFTGNTFKWGAVVNSIGTVLNLGCPFIFCHFYFNKCSYEELVVHVAQQDETSLRDVKLFSKLYTCASVILWVLCAAFFYIHWLPFFHADYQYYIYGVTVFYTSGWWGCWLSIYGFVCHVHVIQIKSFIKFMKLSYGYSSRTVQAEEVCVAELLRKFVILREWLEQTQKDFSKIISFAVIYHVFDLFVFGIAYWKHDFGDYPIWQFICGVSFDCVSILFKLYPAAIVCETLHSIVIASGGQCYLDIYSVKYPKERCMLHQYFFIKEQDMGFRVMGVKITSKLTIVILVTITTAILTFIKYVVPFLSNLPFNF